MAEADISELVEAEQPYTQPRYQGGGLAAADLAALRAGRPAWEDITSAGIPRDFEPFWSAVGTGSRVANLSSSTPPPSVGVRRKGAHDV
jgi:hypothetical protein